MSGVGGRRPLTLGGQSPGLCGSLSVGCRVAARRFQGLLAATLPSRCTFRGWQSGSGEMGTGRDAEVGYFSSRGAERGGVQVGVAFAGLDAAEGQGWSEVKGS